MSVGSTVIKNLETKFTGPSLYRSTCPSQRGFSNTVNLSLTDSILSRAFFPVVSFSYFIHSSLERQMSHWVRVMLL